MERRRSHTYRCYPNATQEHMLARTFGATRDVYNWALRLRTDAYYERQERVYYTETSARLTQLKRQEGTAWLNEVVERQLPLLGARISLAGFRTRSSLPYPSSCPAIAGAVTLISCPCCPFASFAR